MNIKEMSELFVLGEYIAWACVEGILEQFPDSDIKDKISNLIDARRAELVEMEL